MLSRWRAGHSKFVICALASLGALLVMSPAWSSSWSWKSWRTWRTHATLSISGTPPSSVVASQPYRFTPATSGANSESLSFSIVNKPAWASFDTSNGTLSGTPSTGDVGSFSSIQITVSDWSSSASLSPFSIRVTSPSGSTVTPPTISGNPPASVTVGQAYAFTPTAKGPTGTTLSFSIQNKPAWATFSISTGALTGTPDSTNVGVDSSILISVSDSGLSASLQPFSIAVNPGTSTTGSARLTWTAPTTNTDGSQLTDLAGYYVYEGTSASAMQLIATVTSAATTSYTVSNLTSGTWYFAVAAYDSMGAQSSKSQDVSKTF